MRLRRFSVKRRVPRVEFCDPCASVVDPRRTAELERERVRQWVELRGGRAF